MRLVEALFVAKPLNILVIAAVFLAAWGALHFSSFGASRRPWPLLVAAAGWGIYAAWEWLVQSQSPEANIRIDLLVIWPLLGVLSIWSLVRALR